MEGVYPGLFWGVSAIKVGLFILLAAKSKFKA
jgi:hypothetical protein